MVLGGVPQVNRSPSRLPEPRGYLGSALTIAALSGPPFGIIWTLSMGGHFHWDPARMLLIALLAGGSFGGLFGLAMAIFVKGERAIVLVEERDSFLMMLDAELWKLGYRPEPPLESDNLFIYKPTLQAGLFSAKVGFEIHGHQAVIVGPRNRLKTLLKRLNSA